MWGEEVTLDPKSDKTFPKNGITLSVTDGTLVNGTDYRVYKNQTMTISSTAGNITNISLTYSSASYDGGGWAASYQPNSTSWTSPTANGEQARITKIVVTVSGSTPTKYGITIVPTGLGDTGDGFSVNGTYYSSYQYIANAAAAGETITLIASPKTGYKATADCWNVLQGTTPVSVTGSGNNYSFTMPAGNVSISPVYVAESTPSTPTKLGTPSNLSVTNVTATSADLSWDAVANASSYMLTVYDDEFNSLVDNQSVSATTYSVSGLTAETHYNWYVTAVGDGVNYSNSDASNDDEFTTLAQGGGDEPGDNNPSGEEATMAAGTNGSTATVNEKDAIKVGTSKAGGDMTITVPAGATSLEFYAAAWNGVTGLSLNITPTANVSPISVSLTADTGISGNSPFTLSGAESSYKFTIALSNITEETTLTLTSSAAKRFVVWGATYTTSGNPEKTKPVLSFAKHSVTAYLDALDEFKSLTVITNPANLTGVQYSSSDETKATVDANTGVVTINNETTPGSVTITASYAESDDYAAADDASYVINIEANKPVVVKRAIVAEYNGKFYAATTTIENKALVAKEVCVIDGSVVITSEEDVNVISWIVDEENNIYKTEEGKYLSGNKADLSLVDDEAPLNVETRALIYRESAGGFKYYATNNASNEGYSALAEVKPILVLTDEEFAARYTYTRNISNALGTICLPYGVDMTKVSNVKFYTVAGKKLDADNKPESVIFTEVEGNLVAGVPYVFKAEENVSKIELPYTGTAVTAPVAGENGLYGAFVKTYLNSIYANGDEDDFYLITNNTIKAATIEGSYIGINRAYLRMTEVLEYGTTPVESSNKMLVVGKDGFSIEDNGTITLIDAIATDKAEGEIYNLQGQRISRLQQGVNIVNGRKVLR